MRNKFVDNLCKLAKDKDNLVLMTGDLGFNVITKFQDQFPKRYINAGIAEQNMMSVASGLSLCGKNVFVYSIGNFNTLRCIEQIRNDCCYPNANVKIVTVGAGLAYGALGMSHHATEDIAMMRALPNMTIFSPASKLEVDLISQYLTDNIGTCYIRLGKGGEEEIHTAPIQNYEFGAPILLNKGGKILILTSGAIAGEVVKARENLLKENIAIDIATMPIIKPIKEEIFVELIRNYSAVITVEEHTINGGLGSLIAELMMDNGIHIPLKRVGMQDIYASVVGDRSYLLDKYNLGTKAVETVVKSLII